MQMQLGQAERKLQAIAVLYDASVAYFNWKKIMKSFKCIRNTTLMRKHVKVQSLIKEGDKRAIDSVEGN
jgi:hypothetical protein